MFTEKSASIGTSAYIISPDGVQQMLNYHKANGYQEAIPNIMAELFPSSRFTVYPMLFHRAGKCLSFHDAV